MNPLIVLLGLGLIVANLLVSPQGPLLLRALGTGQGPGAAGAGLPALGFPARAPGVPPASLPGAVPGALPGAAPEPLPAPALPISGMLP